MARTVTFVTWVHVDGRQLATVISGARSEYKVTHASLSRNWYIFAVGLGDERETADQLWPNRNLKMDLAIKRFSRGVIFGMAKTGRLDFYADSDKTTTMKIYTFNYSEGIHIE